MVVGHGCAGLAVGMLPAVAGGEHEARGGDEQPECAWMNLLGYSMDAQNTRACAGHGILLRPLRRDGMHQQRAFAGHSCTPRLCVVRQCHAQCDRFILSA